MKLIGSYTSPFVRKISVILLEKNLPFEFVNEFPYQDVNGVGKYNPLGKVPVLVTDDGDGPARLADLGLTVDRTGRFGVDEAKLAAALRANLRRRKAAPKPEPEPASKADDSDKRS